MSLKLPKQFLQKGLDLNKWCVNNIGWEKDDALQILEYLLKNDIKKAVLGGDVYLLENSKLTTLYDNWSCDPFLNEKNLEYFKRSQLKAKSYIMNYRISKHKTLFTFVFSDYVIFENDD